MSDDRRAFFKEWDLSECREFPQEEPASHQAKALRQLDTWFEKRGPKGGAGILVLPTGGGKTFTAVRFLAQGPLSEGYRVLWLAHTHHLLEQAFKCFSPARIGAIRDPRRELRVRVVSGTPGHFPPRDIEATDDVVIGTLQTISNAVQEGLASVEDFIAAAGDKLFVVFDEAHHAPAPSYRKLVQDLQGRGAAVLGLTATPVYSDETKQGWLKKVFPDGILAQARANELMAAGILARPHAVPIKTKFTPKFEQRDYEKWLGTYRDIPEHMIEVLAGSAERNAFIAQAYAENRTKYGKTIIFTDRWYQCEAIAEQLKKHKVRADSVYSHVDARPGSSQQRRHRDADENAKVLQAFRDNKLDVLINVRMLTEGTDIPDAQTVFITRQTTSSILLTQMVGRALRGPKFGGTPDAYIVSFEDDWRQQIQWAGFDLQGGGTADERIDRPKRPPIHLISIDLVKQLARQMSGGSNVALEPFLTHLPLGWYRVLFDAREHGGDDVEPQDLLVMVYEDEQTGFDKLVAHLVAEAPEAMADESLSLEKHQKLIAKWRGAFFPEANRSPVDLEIEILQLARHVAQRGLAPQFFKFEVRGDHDLDAVAERHIRKRIDLFQANEELRKEFAREDRLWRTLFYSYDRFRNFYDGAVARKLQVGTHAEPKPKGTAKAISSEVEDAVKKEVIARDGHACVACGTTRRLEVDHIVPMYSGGSNEKGNLQTLCKQCNLLKRTERMSFLVSRTALGKAHATLPDVRPPPADDAANSDAWERFLRRTLNFFYECSAVAGIDIAQRGDAYYNWTVTLRTENPPEWLKPHLPALLQRIQGVREAGKKPRVLSMRIVAPNKEDILVKDQ